MTWARSTIQNAVEALKEELEELARDDGELRAWACGLARGVASWLVAFADKHESRSAAPTESLSDVLERGRKVLEEARQGNVRHERWKETVEAMKGEVPVYRFCAVVDNQPPHQNEAGVECRCRELDGREAPADDPIWKTSLPPLHEGCRCVIEVVAGKPSQ